MHTERRQEIKTKAKEINDFSEQFQLLHATYASQEFIKSTVQEYFQKKLNVIKKKIEEKTTHNLDAARELEELEELSNVIKNNRFAIDIGYIDISDDNIARVTKNGKSFSIYLAKSLKDSICNPDGSFNYATIGKIRKLMAHELGHIVLHTKEVLMEEGTQGSLNIKNPDEESEADIFAEELLGLRKERNKKIREDGGADKLF